MAVDALIKVAQDKQVVAITAAMCARATASNV